jgi:hypothetical protein
VGRWGSDCGGHSKGQEPPAGYACRFVAFAHCETQAYGQPSTATLGKRTRFVRYWSQMLPQSGVKARAASVTVMCVPQCRQRSARFLARLVTHPDLCRSPATALVATVTQSGLTIFRRAQPPRRDIDHRHAPVCGVGVRVLGNPVAPRLRIHVFVS